MNDDAMIKMLTVILVVMLFILAILVAALIYAKIKTKPKEDGKITSVDKKNNEKANNAASVKTYDKKSIFDFMEFDKIDDNMIIQKNGARYLMVIKCNGVNYDLMSEMEKISVEEGFMQFLNSLRYPIQIYIQTRTVNLEDSIRTYENYVSNYENRLNRMRIEYEQMKKDADRYSEKDLASYNYEIVKQANLYEYARDIVDNTKRMSLNRGILNQQYYIIISYYSAEVNNENFDKGEIKNVAFSELYTRAQTISRTLGVCGIVSKILDSNEIAELLYVAYNRDDSEIYTIEKAIKAKYDELYSTAPDVLEKKMKEINKIVNEQAQELAEEAVRQARVQAIKNRQERVMEQAEAIIDQNAEYIDDYIIESAKEIIRKLGKSKEEGGNEDESTQEQKPKRGRRKASTTKQ